MVYNRRDRIGHWVTRRQQRGRSAVFQRYASDEAREYFRSNPRPTSAYFRGRNTRMHETYR